MVFMSRYCVLGLCCRADGAILSSHMRVAEEREEHLDSLFSAYLYLPHDADELLYMMSCEEEEISRLSLGSSCESSSSSGGSLSSSSSSSDPAVSRRVLVVRSEATCRWASPVTEDALDAGGAENSNS